MENEYLGFSKRTCMHSAQFKRFNARKSLATKNNGTKRPVPENGEAARRNQINLARRRG